MPAPIKRHPPLSFSAAARVAREMIDSGQWWLLIITDQAAAKILQKIADAIPATRRPDAGKTMVLPTEGIDLDDGTWQFRRLPLVFVRRSLCPIFDLVDVLNRMHPERLLTVQEVEDTCRVCLGEDPIAVASASLLVQRFVMGE